MPFFFIYAQVGESEESKIIKPFFDRIWQTIKSFFAKAWNWFKINIGSFFKKISDKIANWWRNLGENWFKNICEDLINLLEREIIIN